MMKQRSTEQRSTVDSRRRLTNFKMLVHQCRRSWDVKCEFKILKCSQKHLYSLLRTLS